MRFLLINEYRQRGGTEVQSLRERDLLRFKGHDVMYLTFDPHVPEVLTGYDLNIPLSFAGVSKLYHRIARIAVSNSLRKTLTTVIEEFNPDIVHVNNVFAAPATIYKCLESYPCFQTIRDYSAVCPKGTCIHSDYSICNGYKYNTCYACIGSNIKQQIENVYLRLLNNRRVQSIDMLVCPSSALSICCTANGLKTKKLTNPFDFSIVQKNQPCFTRTYLYYGGINERKGIVALLDAWKEFSVQASEARLLIVGVVEKGFTPIFNGLLAQTPNIEYLGSMSNADIMDLYKRIYCVVVPSLWLENYPNTVLEALANKTLVIGSNRGGIPELIQSDEFLFDVLSKESIVDTLKRTYEMDEQSYIEITEHAYECCRKQNSLESYYRHIMTVCDELYSPAPMNHDNTPTMRETVH